MKVIKKGRKKKQKKEKSEKNTVIPPSIGSRGNEMVPEILNSLEFESVCKKWLQRS